MTRGGREVFLKSVLRNVHLHGIRHGGVYTDGRTDALRRRRMTKRTGRSGGGGRLCNRVRSSGSGFRGYSVGRTYGVGFVGPFFDPKSGPSSPGFLSVVSESNSRHAAFEAGVTRVEKGRQLEKDKVNARERIVRELAGAAGRSAANLRQRMTELRRSRYWYMRVVTE